MKNVHTPLPGGKSHRKVTAKRLERFLKRCGHPRLDRRPGFKRENSELASERRKATYPTD